MISKIIAFFTSQRPRLSRQKECAGNCKKIYLTVDWSHYHSKKHLERIVGLGLAGFCGEDGNTTP